MADQVCDFSVKDREGDETFIYSEECGFYMVPKTPSPAPVTSAWVNLLREVFDLRFQDRDPEGREYAAIKRLADIMNDTKTPFGVQAMLTSVIHDLTHNKKWLAVEIFGDDAHGDG